MNDKNPNKVFFCSSLAGIICNSLTNPLDVVKVRLQNDAKKCHCKHVPKIGKAYTYRPNISRMQEISVFKLLFSRNLDTDLRTKCQCLPFKTNIKALIYLVRKEGVRTLANGLRQSVFSSTIAAVIFLSLYEPFRRYVAMSTDSPFWIPFLSAFCARGLTTSVIFPFEYWKTVQQSVIGANQFSAFQIGTNVNVGFRSLLIRDLVFACTSWVLLENIRDSMKTLLDHGSLSEGPYQNKETLVISNLIAGIISGGIGAYVSIPFDVVKTRKQLHPVEYGRQPIMQILKEVYQTHGRDGLLLGARQRGWKVTLQTTGVITLYELFMDMFRRVEPEWI